MKEKIVKMEIGEKVNSDHHPVEVTLKGGEVERRRREGRRERREWRG